MLERMFLRKRCPNMAKYLDSTQGNLFDTINEIFAEYELSPKDHNVVLVFGMCYHTAVSHKDEEARRNAMHYLKEIIEKEEEFENAYPDFHHYYEIALEKNLDLL